MYFKRIGDLRVDNDLTQKEMAKILNVPRNTYSKWELGNNNFPLDKLEEFSNYFNVSIDYITGLSNTKTIDALNNYNKNILKERLKLIRKNNNISQQQLCTVLKFYQTTYSGYENGHSTIPIDKLYIFAKKFNISIDYLMGRTNIKKR